MGSHLEILQSINQHWAGLGGELWSYEQPLKDPLDSLVLSREGREDLGPSPSTLFLWSCFVCVSIISRPPLIGTRTSAPTPTLFASSPSTQETEELPQTISSDLEILSEPRPPGDDTSRAFSSSTTAVKPDFFLSLPSLGWGSRVCLGSFFSDWFPWSDPAPLSYKVALQTIVPTVITVITEDQGETIHHQPYVYSLVQPPATLYSWSQLAIGATCSSVRRVSWSSLIWHALVRLHGVFEHSTQGGTSGLDTSAWPGHPVPDKVLGCLEV